MPKHLSALFPISPAALASLSAFAVASPSAIPSSSVSFAQTIGTIVDILTGVDDALQLYNRAVKNWHDQLGSTSFTSLPSTNSTAHSASTTKLLQAQEELRACEAHLAAMELELEGLRPLPSPALPLHVTQSPISYSSDISYLTLSQSASQQHDGPSRGTSQEGVVPDRPSFNGHQEVTITIPPVHAISELTMPTGVRSPSPLSNPLPEISTDLEAHPLPHSSST
ncbi:hypothetical protein DEU56DRAFT_932354 [Suillus clintonianus]|uniref:uncharacterized protein n=1 Tax=Suillus clintonianus TaxID=1904413 RepID=UPI001B86F235|nr:uncharacterized protein DEU56DRAFT_932354 [Suillus clintonianus]KAG2116265.1 hypothetical protein DEU56DRAFT_932354 [Suillus clintonianus]